MSRQRFFFNLGALFAAVLLIVAAAAFGPGAGKGMGLGIGSGGLAVLVLFMSVLVHQRRLEGDPELKLFGHATGLWSMLAGGVAGVATWEIVDVAVFNVSINRSLTLANGLLISALGVPRLAAPELSSQRAAVAPANAFERVADGRARGDGDEVRVHQAARGRRVVAEQASDLALLRRRQQVEDRQSALLVQLEQQVRGVVGFHPFEDRRRL